MMYPLIDALEWLRNMYYYTNNTRKNMNAFDQPHMNKPKLPVPGDVAPFPNGYVSYSPVNPINNLYDNLPIKYAKNIALDPEVKNAREKFSKCNHVNIYGADGVEYKTKNTMHCPICGATWPVKLVEVEEFENAMDVVMTVIQNIKWLNNNDEDFNNIMNNNYGYNNNNPTTRQFPHIRAIFPKEETDTE